MPDTTEIEVYTDHGQKIATHKDAHLSGVDLADTPMVSDYAEIITPGGIYEYHGRIVVEVYTPHPELSEKKDGE